MVDILNLSTNSENYKNKLLIFTIPKSKETLPIYKTNYAAFR